MGLLAVPGYFVVKNLMSTPITPEEFARFRYAAAGDLTQVPIKQGGIAAQQADAAAEAIAAEAGVALEPTPFRPVLRGLLLTGSFPRYLLSEPGRPRSVPRPRRVVGRVRVVL